MLFKVSKNIFIELTDFEAFIVEDSVEIKGIVQTDSCNKYLLQQTSYIHKEKISQSIYKVFIKDLKTNNKYLINTLTIEESAQDFLLKYLTDKTFRFTWDI